MQTSITKRTIPANEQECYKSLYGDDWDIGRYCLVGVLKADSRAKAPRDIDISPEPGVPLPDDYSKLVVEIDRCLTVLRIIFPEENISLLGRYQQYFDELKNIARLSLGQDQVLLGNLEIQAFQDNVIMREGSRIKNKYIKDLGLWALIFGAMAFAAYLVAETQYLSSIIRDRTFFLMILGSMLGTWLSFAIRKPTLSFTELAVIEQDRLEPHFRLLFVAGLTIVVGLLFGTGMVSVKIGGFETDFLPRNPALTTAVAGAAAMRAILIGCLCGIGEQLLPRAVGQRAATFLSAIGGGVERGSSRPVGGGDKLTSSTISANESANATGEGDTAPKGKA
jgi:hypothetical protein